MRRHVLGSGQSSRGGGSVIRASGEKLVYRMGRGRGGLLLRGRKAKEGFERHAEIPFCGSGKSEGMTQPEWDGRLTRQEMSGQGRRHLGCR